LLATTCIVAFASVAMCKEAPETETAADKPNPMKGAVENFKSMGRKKRQSDDEDTEDEDTEAIDESDDDKPKDGKKHGKCPPPPHFKKGKPDKLEINDEEGNGEEKSDKPKHGKHHHGKCGCGPPHGKKGKPGKPEDSDEEETESSDEPSKKIKEAFNKGKDAMEKIFSGRKKRQISPIESEVDDVKVKEETDDDESESEEDESVEDESEEDDESADDGSLKQEDSRKKRLVHYNVRETIEEKFVAF
jgi:hypothetical protein